VWKEIDLESLRTTYLAGVKTRKSGMIPAQGELQEKSEILALELHYLQPSIVSVGEQ